MKFDNPLKSIPAWGFLAIATIFKVIPISLKEAQTEIYCQHLFHY